MKWGGVVKLRRAVNTGTVQKPRNNHKTQLYDKNQNL